ncbi:hypothetical protein HY025_00215 [Candidatus Daviesbacteria bacterium]|nr:hypothetical protein [Candidatus Daviesbacteria bacterium]
MIERAKLEILGWQNARALLSDPNGYSILLFKDDPERSFPSIFAQVVGLVRIAGYFTQPKQRQSQITQDVLAPFQAFKEEVNATHFGDLKAEAVERIANVTFKSILEWILVRRLSQPLIIPVIDIK